MGAFLLGTIVLLFSGDLLQASPLPSKLKYDQRQEGKWNVRADLENFIILVIPTTSSGSSGTPNVSLFDFLSKSIPFPYYKKSKKHMKIHHHQEEDELVPDTEEFIESKTAPYHVDISHARSQLAKLHPVPEGVKEEVIIARSPSVNLAKSNDRASRAILFRIPTENEIKGATPGDKLMARKTIGLSAEAIENGLAEQLMTKESQNHIKPIGVFQAKIEKIIKEKQEGSNKIEEHNKVNDTLKIATLLAETLKKGLIESLRKINEKLREQDRQEELAEEDEEGVVEMVKVEESKKEKMIEKKKPVKVEAPKVNLEPPKVSVKEVMDIKKPEITLQPPKESNKEVHKEELLLLGAENEQCGPGQERDSSGICVTVRKS